MIELTIKEDSMNYTCSVVTITKVFDIPGADHIQRTVVSGNNIIVLKNVNVGDRMLYFVSGTKLSETYCRFNNLFDKAEWNADINKKGFIHHKQCRVKAIKLKNIISDGLLMPVASLDAFDVNIKHHIKLGDAFTDIDGYSLCEKYVVIPVESSTQQGEKTPNQKKSNKLKELIVDHQFQFHHETEHFARHLSKFQPDTEIIITRKMHGSSLILSHVLIHKTLSWKETIARFFGIPIPTSEYGMIWSSGKPKGKLPKGVASATNQWETPNPSYYTSDIWARAYKDIGHTVEKGISIYGEIVGEGIQGKLFTYNQEYNIYVYRITQTSVDGHVVEFSWEQVKKYCYKYGLNHVQHYFVGKVKEISQGDLLETLQLLYLNKSYPDCKIDEGICIRLRETDEIFKLKSPNFIKLESDQQEKGIEEKES